MVLKLDNVQKNYKDFHLNCSLELQSGCVTGLIGANGAGKSTTFKAILDLISIDGGRIELFDKDYKQISVKEKEEIGVVLAENYFSGSLTIRKIIPILSSMYKKFNKQEFMDSCLRFDLPLDKKIMDLSTGMRAKLKLLTAISHEARFLILDEPTAGLDVLAREEVLDLLRNYMEKENRAILISSHISSDLEGFCDDLYMIHEGKIIFHEDTDVLLDQYGLLKVSEEQYQTVDKQQILYSKKEAFGYRCLTKDKQFYLENYPNIVIEKGTIDDVLTMMAKGERV